MLYKDLGEIKYITLLDLGEINTYRNRGDGMEILDVAQATTPVVMCFRNI